MVAAPTVIVVVTVGTTITTVVVELTKVCLVAPEAGTGLGSFPSISDTENSRRKETYSNR